MSATLQALRARWGSVEGYLDHIGVSASLRATLRSLYRVVPSQL
jgi:protein tyrosine/serine phosphatase